MYQPEGRISPTEGHFKKIEGLRKKGRGGERREEVVAILSVGKGLMTSLVREIPPAKRKIGSDAEKEGGNVGYVRQRLGDSLNTESLDGRQN